MSAARRLARAALAASAAAMLFAAGGCALLGRSGGTPTADPAPAGEAADVATTEGSAPGAADPAAAAPESAAPVVPAPAASAASDSAGAAPPAEPPAVEANDQVRFELSDRERDELLAQATRTLTEIRRRLDKLDRSKLDAARQEKLRTIESLVHNAEESMGDDVRASATLSRKARLLLDDLTTQ